MQFPWLYQLLLALPVRIRNNIIVSRQKNSFQIMTTSTKLSGSYRNYPQK